MKASEKEYVHVLGKHAPHGMVPLASGPRFTQPFAIIGIDHDKHSRLGNITTFRACAIGGIATDLL